MSAPDPLSENIVNPADLLTPEEVVDRLVKAVEAEDLFEVLYWIRALEAKGETGRINDASDSGLTPLVAASTFDSSSRTRCLVVRILCNKGAQLPATDAKADLLEGPKSWAIQIAEGGSGDGSQDEKEAKMLLAMSEEDQSKWIDANLPPVERPEAGGGDYLVENQMSGYDEGEYPTVDGQGRSASQPVKSERSAMLKAGLASSPAPTAQGQRSRPARTDAEIKREQCSPEQQRRRAENGNGNGRNRYDVDLTTSRSPSPRIKLEDGAGDQPMPGPSRQTSYSKRPRSRSPSYDRDRYRPRRDSPSARRPPPSPEPEARAHLRLDNLPRDVTSALLETFFQSASISGIITTLLEAENQDAPWALVTFRSLNLAQDALIRLDGKRLEGNEVRIKIYSAEGEPVEPFREVRPRGDDDRFARRYGDGGGGGGAGADRGYGGPFGTGGGFNRAQSAYPQQNQQHQQGPFQPPPRYFPRPMRPPVLMTAAELARRVYCGSLRYGITMEEVDELFSVRAGVKARVLKVMQAMDGSHAFAFVQLPDKTTADFALQQLHAAPFDGHLLQIEHVNEIGHRWLFSLSLHNLPLRWNYRDVSDFLISTIGSFAGLIVSQDNYSAKLNVRIELRYKTELKWAAGELNGLVIDQKTVEATIDQPGVRAEYEREMKYARILSGNQPQAPPPPPPPPGAGSNGYDPTSPSTGAGAGTGGTYDQHFPNLPAGLTANTNGGATPSGGRRAPPPPPPPPPPPGGSGRSPIAGAGAGTRGSTAAMENGAAAEEEEYNPFAPSFMLGGGRK